MSPQPARSNAVSSRMTASRLAVSQLAGPMTRQLPDVKAAGLRLVKPVRSRARRTPFVVVVLGLLSVGLVGLIVMSTVLQAQSFESSRLDQRAADLQTRQQALASQVDKLQSPANVAARAKELGMVRNTNPAFLRLSDGKILGKPVPALPEAKQ